MTPSARLCDDSRSPVLPSRLSLLAESIPHDIVSRAADGNDIGRAVAIQVAAAQVLGGDVAVDDRLLPLPSVRSKSYIETR